MRVACPECSAEYEIPPALADQLTEGRSLRCARCGTAWVPQGAPAAPVAEPHEVHAPAEPEFPRPIDPPPPSYRREAEAPSGDDGEAGHAALAWGTSLVVLAGLAAGAWHWRVSLVEAWPPLARVFMALGLAA